MIDIEAEGKSSLERLLYLILLGDFVSYYLAVLYGVDPTEIPKIDRLKASLKAKSK